MLRRAEDIGRRCGAVLRLCSICGSLTTGSNAARVTRLSGGRRCGAVLRLCSICQPAAAVAPTKERSELHLTATCPRALHVAHPLALDPFVNTTHLPNDMLPSSPFPFSRNTPPSSRLPSASPLCPTQAPYTRHAPCATSNDPLACRPSPFDAASAQLVSPTCFSNLFLQLVLSTASPPHRRLCPVPPLSFPLPPSQRAPGRAAPGAHSLPLHYPLLSLYNNKK